MSRPVRNVVAVAAGILAGSAVRRVIKSWDPSWKKTALTGAAALAAGALLLALLPRK